MLVSSNVCYGADYGKQKNILVDGNQRARVCDFGLSRVQKSTSGARSGYTTSTLAGSVRWMSPELVKHDQDGSSTAGFTRESDVWAFGCLILEVRCHKLGLIIGDG